MKTIKHEGRLCRVIQPGWTFDGTAAFDENGALVKGKVIDAAKAETYSAMALAPSKKKARK